MFPRFAASTTRRELAGFHTREQKRITDGNAYLKEISDHGCGQAGASARREGYQNSGCD
jgi:hypothetical protein